MTIAFTHSARNRQHHSAPLWIASVSVIALTLTLCLLAGFAFAYWTASSTSPGVGSAAAATLSQGATPTASASGATVTVSWAGSTLGSGEAATGYTVKRFAAASGVQQSIGSACSATIVLQTCAESNVPTGSWTYSVTPHFGSNWRGNESARSATVSVDTVAPVNNLSITVATGNAYLSGTTIFYRGTAAGSLTITNAVSDVGSGAQSSTTSALGGTATNFAHTPSTVITPAGGPFVSNVVSWTPTTSSTPTIVVTATDVAGLTTSTTLSFVSDSAPPTASITYTNGFSVGRYVDITLTAADTGSGVAHAQIQRSSARYVDGACGTYLGFVDLGSVNPSSPYRDSTVTNARCYVYRYVVADQTSNTFTATSPNTAIVDYAAAVASTPSVLSRWRLGDSAQSTVAVDNVGTRPGTYLYGVTQGVNGELPGDADTAAYFSGASQYVASSAAGMPVGAANRSVEMWFKTSATVQQTLFGYGSQGENQQFGLWIDAGGASLTAWGYGGGNDKVFTPTKPVNDGKWHHIVKTWNGSVITLYIDGIALPAQVATRNTVLDSSGFAIGVVANPNDAVNSHKYFVGSIDEVSLYSSSLSAITVLNHYQLGENSTTDSMGPTGGSVTVTGLTGTGSRYSTSTTLNLALAGGSDASGVALGARLMRAAAPLVSTSNSDGACGAFGSFVLVANDPTLSTSNVVADQSCYVYHYVVGDTQGNYTTYSSAVVKVDSSVPSTPTLAFSAFTSTYLSGTTLYYRANSATGAFTVAAASTDTAAGVASYSFPALGANWVTTTNSAGSRTYSWTTTPAGSGARLVTATNNAGGTSAGASYSIAADTAAPTLGTLAYTDGATTATSQSITFTAGTDADSGIASRSLQRATATLTGSTCGTFGAFTPIATNTTSPFADTVVAGQCYKYQYVVTDNLGNASTTTSVAVMRVSQASSRYEAESATLTGGAVVATDHTGYSGTGFVAGFIDANKPNAKTSFTVTVPGAGLYTLSLRYSNGQGAARTVSSQVDATAVAQITLPATASWDAWSTYTFNAQLSAGTHTISFFYGAADTGNVNLDYLEISGGYAARVAETVGLTNYFRLNDTTRATDSFTGTAGTLLQSRTPELGGIWQKQLISDGSADAVLTNAGRLRKGTGSSYGSMYLSPAIPASANYTVSADIYAASNVAQDQIGVVGRLTTGTAPSYYVARFERAYNELLLFRVVGDNWTVLGTAPATLADGSTTGIALDMNGSRIRVLVNGIERVSVIDDAVLSGAGRAGVALGYSYSDAPVAGPVLTTITDTTGMHLDNFAVNTGAVDAMGVNRGVYVNGPILGTAGALSDSTTAVTFDGVNDFATAARQISGDFSIEFWMKSTGGIGTGVNWWQGAALVDADLSGDANDFGVSLRSDGRIVAGTAVGTTSASALSSPGKNDGNWHHVVFTRSSATGVLRLYVDGVADGTATSGIGALTSQAIMTFGRSAAGGYFYAGSLDEVATYSSVLSPATIAAHYGAR